jgi:hypothetical protein
MKFSSAIEIMMVAGVTASPAARIAELPLTGTARMTEASSQSGM